MDEGGRFPGFAEDDSVNVKATVQDKLTRINNVVNKITNDGRRIEFDLEPAGNTQHPHRRLPNRFLKRQRSESLPSTSSPNKISLVDKRQVSTASVGGVVNLPIASGHSKDVAVDGDCKPVINFPSRKSIVQRHNHSSSVKVLQQQISPTPHVQLPETDADIGISTRRSRVNKFLKTKSSPISPNIVKSKDVKNIERGNEVKLNHETTKQDSVGDFSSKTSTIQANSEICTAVLSGSSKDSNTDRSSISAEKAELFLGIEICTAVTKPQLDKSDPSDTTHVITSTSIDIKSDTNLQSEESVVAQTLSSEAKNKLNKQPAPTKRTASISELSFLTGQSSRSKRTIVPNKRFFSTDSVPVLSKQEDNVLEKSEKSQKSTNHAPISQNTLPANKSVKPVVAKTRPYIGDRSKRKRKLSTDTEGNSPEEILSAPLLKVEKPGPISTTVSPDISARPRRTIIPNRKFLSDDESLPSKEQSAKKSENIEPKRKRRKSEKVIEAVIQQDFTDDKHITDHKNGLPELETNDGASASTGMLQASERSAIPAETGPAISNEISGISAEVTGINAEVTGVNVEATGVNAEVTGANDAKVQMHENDDEISLNESEINTYLWKPQFLGACLIKMAENSKETIKKELGNDGGIICCGICGRVKKYRTAVVKRKRGSFLCSDCIVIVGKIYQLALKAKPLACIIGPPVCEGSCPLLFDPVDQFCQACFAKSCLKNLPMKDDVYFKIWRSIPPMSRGCVPTIPVVNHASPNVGKIVFLNEQGEISSATSSLKVLGKKFSSNGIDSEDSNSSDNISNGVDLNSARITSFPHRTESFSNRENTIPLKNYDESRSDPNTKLNGVSKEEILLGRQISQERVKALIDPILKPELEDIEIFGFPVVVSGPSYPRKPLCFLCGSAGIEQLLFCSMCCEPFHPYCAGDDLLMDTYISRCNEEEKHVGGSDSLIPVSDISLLDSPNEKQIYTSAKIQSTNIVPLKNIQEVVPTVSSRMVLKWTCRRCLTCKVCEESIGSRELIRCNRCQSPFHLLTCIDKIFLNKIKDWDRLKKIWTCDACLKCKSCGKKIESSRKVHTIQNAETNVDDTDCEIPNQISSLMLCHDCFKQRKKGSFCPFCEVCYDDNDWDSKMMECCRCNRWIHSACENLCDEQYHVLGTLPEDIEYICRLCEPCETPIWYNAIQSQLIKECSSALRLFEKKAFGGELRRKRASTEIKPSYVCNLFGKMEEEKAVDNFARVCELTNENIKNEICGSDRTSRLRYSVRKTWTYKEMTSCKVVLRNFVKYPTNIVENWHSLKLLGVEILNSPKFLNQGTVKSVKTPIYTTPVKVGTPTKNVMRISESVRNAIAAIRSLHVFRNLIMRAVEDLSDNVDEKDVLVKYVDEVMKEIFPWFDPNSKPLVTGPVVVENSELRRDSADSDCQQVSPTDPFKEMFWDVVDFFDDRMCTLCGEVGDFPPDSCGRILWAGTNDWIHCNCAIWSSEVWELENGALQQIGAALIRGRTLRCTVCTGKGATVSCCNSGCKKSYHFLCAIEAKCFLLEDKTMFCPSHKLTPDQEAEIQHDMKIGRKVFVDLEWIHKRGLKGFSDDVKVFVGSLKVGHLGTIVPISVAEADSNSSSTFLIPTNFKAHRVFWSFDDPWRKECYTFETGISSNGFANKVHDVGVNLIVDHSRNEETVKRSVENIKKFFEWLSHTPKFVDENLIDWLSPCAEEFTVEDDICSMCDTRSPVSYGKLPLNSRLHDTCSLQTSYDLETDNSETMSLYSSTSSADGSGNSTPKSSRGLRLKRRRSSVNTRKPSRKRPRLMSNKNTSPRRQSMRNLRFKERAFGDELVESKCAAEEESDDDSGVVDGLSSSGSCEGEKLRCRVNLLNQFNETVEDSGYSFVKQSSNLNDTDITVSDCVSELSHDESLGQNQSQLSDTIDKKVQINYAVINYKLIRNKTEVCYNSYDAKLTWMYLFERASNFRIMQKLKPLIHPTLGAAAHCDKDLANSFRMLGITHRSVQYLLEQLPEALSVVDQHKFNYSHKPYVDPNNEYAPVQQNNTGCARSEGFTKRKPFDMFGWLACRHRQVSMSGNFSEETSRSQGLPLAMRYRDLGEKANRKFVVLHSEIHGRGLYTRCDVEKGDMIIEYAGEVIRPSLTDSRERYYESRGIGCYMFRIKTQVIDATLKGNAARFINHSCEPNCEAKTVRILGKDHIIIFALRKIFKGEELTYDYKFEREDDKIPCTCGAAKCRKYLN